MTADAAVLTSQANTPPTLSIACFTSSSRWCTNPYGACQPSVSVPCNRMWPPTHSIATVPTVDSVASTLGIAATRPRPRLLGEP